MSIETDERQEDEEEYSAGMILEILNSWPKWTSAKERGTMIVAPTAYRSNKFESKLYRNKIANEMWHRPHRKSNSVYRIDDVAAVVCDIERAMSLLSKELQWRLYKHFYEGYSQEEVADLIGISQPAVHASIIRAAEQMSDYLCGYTAKPQQTGVYKSKYEYTHTRTYKTFS